MLNFAKQQKKNFELNVKHPLVERLLEKVEDAEHDEEVATELKETVQILWYASSLSISISLIPITPSRVLTLYASSQANGSTQILLHDS